jgi:hypothetical protein
MPEAGPGHRARRHDCLACRPLTATRPAYHGRDPDARVPASQAAGPRISCHSPSRVRKGLSYVAPGSAARRVPAGRPADAEAVRSRDGPATRGDDLLIVALRDSDPEQERSDRRVFACGIASWAAQEFVRNDQLCAMVAGLAARGGRPDVAETFASSPGHAAAGQGRVPFVCLDSLGDNRYMLGDAGSGSRMPWLSSGPARLPH